MVSAPLLVAIVETEPRRRIHLETPDDASWLADLSGCRVRLVHETLVVPLAREAGLSSTPASSPEALAEEWEEPGEEANALEDDEEPLPPTITDLVREHMRTDPGRIWRGPDFSHLSETPLVCCILNRLLAQGELVRVRRGGYRFLGKTPRTVGSTTGTLILRYMRKHEGAWFTAPALTKALGLPVDRTNAVAGALARLEHSGKIDKRRGIYRYLSERARQEAGR